jgi:hypothetical protein
MYIYKYIYTYLLTIPTALGEGISGIPYKRDILIVEKGVMDR